MEIEIDKLTLPSDGEKIVWQTEEDFENGTWKQGVFNSGDDLFLEGFEDTATKWDLSWNVLHWKPFKIAGIIKTVMIVLSQEDEAKRQKALDEINNAYYDIKSPHYRDNQRYSCAVNKINRSYFKNFVR